MKRLLPLLAGLAVCVTAAPAGAVVNGEPVSYASVPTFAFYGCGGTLIAPDRVVTAIHCLDVMSAVESVSIGGRQVPVANVAMHPSWRVRNAENFALDVALLQLATPVTGVTPATLGEPRDHVGELGVIVGNGRSTAPGTKGDGFGGGLRAADLRIMSDADCTQTFGTARGNTGETFLPGSSFCAIDADGRAPLTSGCNGDSGGPLFVGPATAPVLLGVVSYGGLKCGADHLPSVFADVSEARGFLTDPTPVWAPKATTPARVTGARRPGGTLTCTVPAVPAGAKAEVEWKRFTGRGAPKIVGRKASIRVGRKDRGTRYLCIPRVTGAGGFARVPDSPDVLVRIR